MMLNRGSYPDGLPDVGFVTFASDLTASDIGKAVMASGSYNTATGVTVALATSGSQVVGRVESVDADGACSIDLAGSHFKEFTFVAGCTPSLGQGIYGGATAGTVVGVAIGSGGRGLVVSLDESNHKVLVLV